MAGSRYSAMLIALLLPGLSTGGGIPSAPTGLPGDAVIGRWDVTIQESGRTVPSWFEIRRSGRETLVGRFVGPSGSARPIAKVEVSGADIRFTIPPQWDVDKGDLTVAGRLDGDRLTGTMSFANGERVSWTAQRAPLLRRRAAPHWGTPIRLLNGRDLAGWHSFGDGQNKWRVEGGVLRNTGGGANLATDRTFSDFKLHIEFRYPPGSNSGVYLRGRYEVQIADTVQAEPEWDVLLGGIYGFLPPTELAARKPGEWQSFDVTLIGRRVTVVVNGKQVIIDREIPGITGGALDSDEGAPGPLYLQGDHGPIDYRNVVLTPAMP